MTSHVYTIPLIYNIRHDNLPGHFYSFVANFELVLSLYSVKPKRQV